MVAPISYHIYKKEQLSSGLDITLVPKLEGRVGDIFGASFILEFINPQTFEVVKQIAISPISGLLRLLLDISAGLYDLQVSAEGYLSTKVKKLRYPLWSFYKLPELLASDFNGNDVVNTVDFSIMSLEWENFGQRSDINGDGIVNAINFSFLNKNWLKQSQT